MDGNSLENQEDSLSAPPTPPVYGGDEKKSSMFSMFKLNKRLLLALTLLVLILLAGTIFSLMKMQKKTTSKTIVINTQSLSNGTLNRVSTSLGNSGKVTTQLTISPSTLFKNDVEIQGKASTDGDLNVGGNLSVKGSINGGTNLSVAGQITAASLSVSSLSLGTLNLTGDLNIGGHILPSGNTPAVSANEAADGGSVSITGNDISGTVTINTGNIKGVAGEMAIITFHTPFATSPKVQLTPVNAQSAQILSYVSQSTKFFSIECAVTPATGTTYTFNYFVTQ